MLNFIFSVDLSKVSNEEKLKICRKYYLGKSKFLLGVLLFHNCYIRSGSQMFLAILECTYHFLSLRLPFQHQNVPVQTLLFFF